MAVVYVYSPRKLLNCELAMMRIPIEYIQQLEEMALAYDAVLSSDRKIEFLLKIALIWPRYFLILVEEWVIIYGLWYLKVIHIYLSYVFIGKAPKKYRALLDQIDSNKHTE